MQKACCECIRSEESRTTSDPTRRPICTKGSSKRVDESITSGLYCCIRSVEGSPQNLIDDGRKEVQEPSIRERIRE